MGFLFSRCIIGSVKSFDKTELVRCNLSEIYQITEGEHHDLPR